MESVIYVTVGMCDVVRGSADDAKAYTLLPYEDFFCAPNDPRLHCL